MNKKDEQRKEPRKHRKDCSFEEICEGIRKYRDEVCKNMNFAPRKRK